MRLMPFNAKTAKPGDRMVLRASTWVRLTFKGYMHGLVCLHLDDDELPDRVMRDCLVQPSRVGVPA